MLIGGSKESFGNSPNINLSYQFGSICGAHSVLISVFPAESVMQVALHQGTFATILGS